MFLLFFILIDLTRVYIGDKWKNKNISEWICYHYYHQIDIALTRGMASAMVLALMDSRFVRISLDRVLFNNVIILQILYNSLSLQKSHSKPIFLHISLDMCCDNIRLLWHECFSAQTERWMSQSNTCISHHTLFSLLVLS